MEVMSSKRKQLWLGHITPSASAHRQLEAVLGAVIWAVILWLSLFWLAISGLGVPYLHADMQRPLDCCFKDEPLVHVHPIAVEVHAFHRVKVCKTCFSNTVWPGSINA